MTAFTKDKSVVYCYPTSDEAKHLGYHDEGCFYVQVDGQVLHSSVDRTHCVNYAKSLPNAWNKYFLRFHAAWLN